MTRIRSSAARGLLAFLLGTAAAPEAAAADVHARARSGATLASLFSSDDYPAEAIRNRQQGAVAFRLGVGPDGLPSDCTVTSSSGWESLDSTTCRLLMERARFEPARDSEGRAVSDSFNGRIFWRLPGEGAMSRSEAAMSLWGMCVFGEAAKLASSDLPAEEVARRAYLPCAALEAVVKGESGDDLERQRSMVVQGLEQFVFKPRAILAAPRPIPIPSKP